MSELERRVRRWRFERLRALWLEGSLRLAAVVALYFLAASLFDAILTLPQGLRWAVFGLGMAASAAGAHAWLLRPLRLLDPGKVLRAVAPLYPAAGAYLRPAWELSRARAQAHTSQELAREHLARTERILKDLPREAAFSWKPSSRSSRSLTFVAAAWGLGLPWLQQGSSVERILSPWRDLRLESLVEIKPEDERLSWGEPALIEVRWRQPRPDARLYLEVRSASAGWRRVPWDQEGPIDSYRVDALPAPLEYRAGFKDIRTRAFALTPIPVPRLTRLKARVQRPGETGPEPVEFALDGGAEVAALRGSWVSLTGSADQPLSSARLDVSFLGTPVRMTRLPTGEWEGGFPLNENGTFKIDLVAGSGAHDPDPVAYALRALDDQPPSVELLSPAFELEISPKERLPVTYAARDDYGLTAISLVYQAPGRDEVEVPLKRLPAGTKETLGDYSWDVSRLPMGAKVEFRIKALDNARPKAQAGFSAKGVVHVTDFDSIHQEAERKWRDVQESLKRLAEGEAKMTRTLRELAPAAGRARPPLPEGAERQERALDGQWAESVSGMEELARLTASDPYANPGMAETAQALAAALKAVQGGEEAKAKAAARSADYAESARRHEEAESRVRRAGEIMAGGRELQAMQDFLGEAYRMDEAGSQLQQALEKAAAGKALSAEDRKSLDQALSNLQKEMDSLAAAINSLPKAEPGSFQDRNRKVYSVPLNSARTTADALRQALERGHYAAAAELARQLSRELAQVRSAIAAAARSAIEEGPEQEAARAIQDAARLWQDVIEEQSRGLQMTQKTEEQGRTALRSAQENLLKELAREQAAAVREGESLGAAMPSDALDWMRQVLGEFSAAHVRDSPQLLDRTIGRLRAQAARSQQPQAPSAAALTGLADREQDIRDRLKRGASPPPPNEAMLSDLMAAEAVQKQVTRKTGELEGKLTEAARAAGSLPPRVTESLQSAQSEQRGAEEALGGRDSARAQAHQEKALERLEEGLKSLNESLQQQQSIGSGASGGFSGPRGVVRPMGGARGRTGADTSFVPLPRKEDYQPPLEIRREVEKSLRERRPGSFDDVIKDYFKKMSQ